MGNERVGIKTPMFVLWEWEMKLRLGMGNGGINSLVLIPMGRAKN